MFDKFLLVFKEEAAFKENTWAAALCECDKFAERQQALVCGYISAQHPVRSYVSSTTHTCLGHNSCEHTPKIRWTQAEACCLSAANKRTSLGPQMRKCWHDFSHRFDLQPRRLADFCNEAKFTRFLRLQIGLGAVPLPVLLCKLT